MHRPVSTKAGRLAWWALSLVLWFKSTLEERWLLAQLDAIADQINNRPRKGLGVRSPLAVYRDLLLNSPQHSTLVH